MGKTNSGLKRDPGAELDEEVFRLVQPTGKGALPLLQLGGTPLFSTDPLMALKLLEWVKAQQWVWRNPKYEALGYDMRPKEYERCMITDSKKRVKVSLDLGTADIGGVGTTIAEALTLAVLDVFQYLEPVQ